MGLVRRRRSRRAGRSGFRRLLRRVVVLGGIASAVNAYRNKQVEANRRRYDLP